MQFCLLELDSLEKMQTKVNLAASIKQGKAPLKKLKVGSLDILYILRFNDTMLDYLLL